VNYAIKISKAEYSEARLEGKVRGFYSKNGKLDHF
jgi:hypothetical protein